MIDGFCTLVRIRPVSAGAFLVSSLILGLFAADCFVPGLIESAYDGKGPARANQFFAARRDRHTLEHYLLLWRNFRDACAIASIAYVFILAIIGRSVRSGRLRGFLVVFAAFFLGMTVLWGPRQDYVAHLKIWEEANAGRDPWWIQPESGIVLNAYGPLFETLAPLVRINPLAPKILFSSAFLIYAIFTLTLAANHPAFDRNRFRLLAAWLANPFFWLEIAFYGHFDVIAGLFVLGAIHAMHSRAQMVSGTLLGLGFLLKFVPGVLVPFLAFEYRGRWRANGRFLIASTAVISGGMAIAWKVWGESVFRPLAFVSTRGSSLLSIWRYLKGPCSPLALAGSSPPDLDRYATPALMIALLATWAMTSKRRSEMTHASLCALMVTVLFYRVGFVQYQMFPFLLLPLWYSKCHESIDVSRAVRLAVFAYVTWIVGFDLFDNAVGGIVGQDRPWSWAENWVGLPNFVLGMILLANLLRMPTDSAESEST